MRAAFFGSAEGGAPGGPGGPSGGRAKLSRFREPLDGGMRVPVKYFLAPLARAAGREASRGTLTTGY